MEKWKKGKIKWKIFANALAEKSRNLKESPGKTFVNDKDQPKMMELYTHFRHCISTIEHRYSELRNNVHESLSKR